MLQLTNQIKLADFGFARQFSTNMDMTSLAGTPVFMVSDVIDYDVIVT